MAEPCDRARFADQALAATAIGREFRQQQLDRDRAIHRGLMCPVHRANAAFGNFLASCCALK